MQCVGAQFSRRSIDARSATINDRRVSGGSDSRFSPAGLGFGSILNMLEFDGVPHNLSQRATSVFACTAAIVAGVAMGFGGFQGVPSARADVDVTHYDLDIQLDPIAKLLTAVATVTFDHEADQEVSLNLVGFQVHSVALDGAPASFDRSDGLLTLATPSLTPGAHTLEVAYSGTPEPYVETWGQWGIKWEEARVYAVNVTHGARYWFPSHDVVHDKATVDFTITVPAGWVATAPGLQTGTAPYTYTADWPISPYLIAFYAGTYTVQEETHGNVDVSYWLYPTPWSKASALFDEMGPMLAWLEGRYGEFPYPKLSWVEINLGGAVEVPSCIAIGTQVVASNAAPNKGVIVHELAHSWFQGVVTIASWDDLWLSEGMATYHEALWTEHTLGPEAFRDAMRAVGQSYRSVAEILEGYFPVYAPQELFGFTVYRKGAHIWHTIRGLLGDANFDVLVATYLTTFHESVASTEDLQGLLQTALDTLGDAHPHPTAMPASRFIQEWVKQTGYPVYEVDWRLSSDGATVLFDVAQTQSWEGHYWTPVALAARGDGQETRHWITYSAWAAAVQGPRLLSGAFPVSHAVDELVLDPDAWVLHDAVLTQLPQESVEPEPVDRVSEAGPDHPPEQSPEQSPDHDAPDNGNQANDLADVSGPGSKNTGCGATPSGPNALWLLLLALALFLIRSQRRDAKSGVPGANEQQTSSPALRPPAFVRPSPGARSTPT